MRSFLIAAALLWTAPASAQGFFKLDAVFVSRFLADPDTLDVEAQELHRMLEKYLSEGFLVTPLETVPPFDDYSAAVYLQNCPPKQYNECSYVIAGRAKANWSITARYSSDNPFDDFGDRDVEVSIIDVESSRAVISFGATVGPGKEEVFAKGVYNVLNKIIAGERDVVDIRENVTDERADWERKREAAAEAAEELSGYEDIDLIVRGMSFDDGLDEERIKVDDLAEYDDRDDAAPWERLNMGREQYVRFKNSGRTVNEWQRLGHGRTRQLLVKLSAGFGGGPYHHRFDGRWALDDTTLAVAEVDVFHEVNSAPNLVGGFEVGFGLMPTVDISVGSTLRTGTYAYYFHQEVVSNPEPEGLVIQAPWWTPAYNGRVTFAPLPTSSLRPSVHAGATIWKGSSIHSVLAENLPPQVAMLGPYDAPSFIFLDVGGGVEFRLGENLDFFTRTNIAVKMVGTRFYEAHSGAEVLFTRGIPTDGGGGLGVDVAAGLMFRFAPFGEPEVEGEWDPLLDDEPDF